MSAILTDQFRILRASEFISSIEDNNYYTFLSVPYTVEIDSNWSSSVPKPIDSFDEENRAFDNIVALSKITSDDVRQVVKKYTWISGDIYEMYRHDYTRDNRTPTTLSTRLYDSKFYVMTDDYRIYICLQNGTDPDNNQGRPSINKPTHTTITPQAAGDGSDKYIWKYLYTLKPSDIIKFDSTDYIPVPANWTSSNSEEISNIRDAAVDGSIEVAVIKNSGVGYGSAQPVTNIPIVGDGHGAKASITISSEGKVVDVAITNKGQGYSYGTLDISNIPGLTHSGTSVATFDIIISPKGGHGKDIYRELGANKVLLYSRYENLQFQNPDVISSNSFARLGIVRNPESFDGVGLFDESTASGLYALKLTGANASTASFVDDERIIQTVGTNKVAVGRVASYDETTQVLKYWQDRSLVLSQPKGGPSSVEEGSTPEYGYELFRFDGNSSDLTISQPDNPTPNNLSIDSSFDGTTTTINNRVYELGQAFTNGVANPEIKPRSGDIIYIDNRESIPRSRNQKEDIKIIIEF